MTRIEDESVLTRLASMWLEKLDWPFEVVDGQLGIRGLKVTAHPPSR